MSRFRTACMTAAAALLVALGPAKAADKVTFLTSWYAQAEHGGFYQAKATGLYDQAGLDVTIKMGGPQVNGMQLLLAGETAEANEALREAVTFACWPPGPEERDARIVISLSGTAACLPIGIGSSIVGKA